MKQSSSRAWRQLSSALSATCLVVVVACSSDATPTLAAACDGTPNLGNADFCKKTCTISASASPNSCKAPRTVNACCTFVQPPTQELARGTGLVRNSSTDPVLQLGCLDNPGPQGASKPITLTGYVRVFSSGGDSSGVKIEIYKEGTNGALGELVGTPVSTTKESLFLDRKEASYLKKCPDGGCTYRAFTYPGVPTETPLIVKTSAAAAGDQWAALYDYNVAFSNGAASGDTIKDYQVAAVAATDINIVASAVGGFTVRQDKGLLAGEVHDCGDVRVAGATVDTDVAHEGDMFYFGENEADPLPDNSRGSLGTSKLGLFGALNLPTGQPVRISAVGKVGGQPILLGTYIVQTFPGAVTALSFRGRRPWQ